MESPFQCFNGPFCAFISTYVGLFGVFLILLAYFLLQIGRVNPKDFLYSLINLFGSICLLFSLLYNWNFPSVVIEVIWFCISLYGLWRSKSRKLS